ncbi:MAG: hypothetical protein EHM39_14030 [Chloroflexi bacterium]|nr:MAG: hypothetical protein EHM39_14030 [Chloroflexota bacterium]
MIEIKGVRAEYKTVTGQYKNIRAEYDALLNKFQAVQKENALFRIEIANLRNAVTERDGLICQLQEQLQTHREQLQLYEAREAR